MHSAEMTLVRLDNADVITTSSTPTPSGPLTFTLSNFFDNDETNGTITNDLTKESWVNNGSDPASWLNRQLGYMIGGPVNGETNFRVSKSQTDLSTLCFTDGQEIEAFSNLFNTTFIYLLAEGRFEKYQQ